MKDELLKDLALVILFIIGTWAKDWMQKRKEKREAVKKQLQEKAHEEAGVDEDLKTSVKIYNELTDLLLIYNAVRAYIKQFHNGSAFYSGQKIQRQTISHEKCRPGVQKITTYHDGIIIPLEVHSVLDWMHREKNDVYYCDDPDKIKGSQPELYQWMRDYSSPSILYVRLADMKTGNTIGLLGVNFNHRSALNTDEVERIAATTKKALEKIFDKL